MIDLVAWYAQQVAQLRRVPTYRPSQLLLGSLVDHTTSAFWDWGKVWKALGNK